MKKLFKILMIVAICGATIGMVSCKKDKDGSDNGSDDDSNLGLTAGEWIDLGLPSGLLWRAYNLGATTPEGYGQYYAWGETSTKSHYDESTYVYLNESGDDPGFTKYCNQSYMGYNGFRDNLITLQPSDDAATVVLGNGARIPTSAEWQEMLDNTKSVWMNVNDVLGRKFISRINGNSFFLPASGDRSGACLYGVGDYGVYWSSSLSIDGSPDMVFAMDFSAYSPRLDDSFYRYAGYSVRAVRPTR